MTAPLWALAFGSIVIGFPGSPFMHHWFQKFMAHMVHHPEYEPSAFVMACSVAAAVCGISLAGVIYLKKIRWAQKTAETFSFLYRLSLNKCYFDELYSRCIVKPFQSLGRFLFGFDARIVDGAVNGTGHATLFISAVKGWIDKYIVDGLVNFTGTLTHFLNSIVKRLQTGFVQNYLLIVFIGILVFLVWELKII